MTGFVMRGQSRGRSLRGSGEELSYNRPTSPILPVGEVRGDGDPPALAHAGTLQALVHPGDDVALPHVGVVRVVAGVAAGQGGEASKGVRGAPALADSSEPPRAAEVTPASCLPRSPALPPQAAPLTWNRRGCHPSASRCSGSA